MATDRDALVFLLLRGGLRMIFEDGSEQEVIRKFLRSNDSVSDGLSITCKRRAGQQTAVNQEVWVHLSNLDVKVEEPELYWHLREGLQDRNNLQGDDCAASGRTLQLPRMGDAGESRGGRAAAQGGCATAERSAPEDALGQRLRHKAARLFRQRLGALQELPRSLCSPSRCAAGGRCTASARCGLRQALR